MNARHAPWAIQARRGIGTSRESPPARVKWPCKLMSIWTPICSWVQRVNTAFTGGRADEAGVGSYANVPRSGLWPATPP